MYLHEIIKDIRLENLLWVYRATKRELNERGELPKDYPLEVGNMLYTIIDGKEGSSSKEVQDFCVGVLDSWDKDRV